MKTLSGLLVAVAFVATNLGMATVVEGGEGRHDRPGQVKRLSAKLVVPLTGAVAGGGTFNGTLSIQRFEARAGAVHVVGTIAGAIPGVGSVVHGPVALPVTAITGGTLPAGDGVITQQQAPCDVLHLQIGGITLDLLGLQVTLSPVTLDIVGGTGPLGTLICEIVELLDNIVGLVGLLNQLLGLLGGLLGGLGLGA